MQRKLKRKFVLIAMAALLVVLLLLIAGLNGGYYSATTKTLDRTLAMLAENGGELPRVFPGTPFGGPQPPERRFTTRYFVLRCDGAGAVRETSLEHISSVSGSEAADYARAVLERGRSRGYTGDYRFLTYQDGEETVLIFLNAGTERQAMRTLLLLSAGVGLASLLVLLALVLLLSRHAISPFVKNVENQRRFITDAGHELKTPLTAIATSADILAMDDGDNEWVQNIRRQSARLSRLVGDLVTLSRLDEEAPLPEQTDLSLSQALWESAEPFASLAKAQGKGFEQEIEDALTLHGDVAAIQRMLSVLLDNALKYSDPGGVIRLEAFKKRQKTVIQVTNPCAGLDKRDLGRLFDRFYRGDPARSDKTEGTGVGLSIAQAIVQAHGGDISVRAPEEGVVCFRVTL